VLAQQFLIFMGAILAAPVRMMNAAFRWPTQGYPNFRILCRGQACPPPPSMWFNIRSI
jgi:hypothetical protein